MRGFLALAITSSEIKILRVLEKIKEKVDSASLRNYKLELVEFVNILEDELTPNVEDYDLSKKPSILIPVESVSKKTCCNPENVNMDWAIDVLTREKVGVYSFDGSLHSLGRHFSYSLNVVNVGFWFKNYGNDSHGWGNEVDVIVDKPEREVKRFLSKKFEYEVLIRHLEDLNPSHHKFILYDESFNLLFTLSWDQETRTRYARMVNNHLNLVLSNGYYPIAVFYTNSTDLVRTYQSKKNKKTEVLSLLQDKAIMDLYLSNFARSNVFKVYNKVVSGLGMEISAFYLKIRDKNVFRVEFPSILESKADFIHKVVLAQSIIGMGYPLALQRAHEWAVLTSQDRELIERETARLLGIPYVEMAYSGKRRSKRRPIV